MTWGRSRTTTALKTGTLVTIFDDLQPWTMLAWQVWANCTPNANHACSEARNLWDVPIFLGAHNLPSQRLKTIWSTGFQSNRWNNKNVTVKVKYYHEHQRTCDILIKFTCLMAPKLLYLLIDWEAFNHLSALEQINGVIRAIQTSTVVLFAKVVCNVNWKALIILTKRLILDAWLGPVRASTDWYIIVLKNKTKIYKSERQVKMESL